MKELNIIDFLKKNKKTFLISLTSILFVLIVGLLFLIFVPKKSCINLISVNNQQGYSLISKNKAAKKAFVKAGDCAIFEFSTEHEELFTDVFNQHDSLAMVLRVEISPSEKIKQFILEDTKIPFNFGFIDDSNYYDNKLNEDFSNNICVYVDLNSFHEDVIMLDLSLALPYSKDILNHIPRGFFVDSAYDCKILSACVSPCMLGFDNSIEPYAFFGFSSNGGIVDSDFSSFDFSAADLVFPKSTFINEIQPEYIVKFSDNKEYKSTVDSSVKSIINFGGEKIFVKNVPNVNELTIPSSSLKNPYSFADISKNKHCILSLLLKQVDDYEEKVKEHNLENYKYVLTPIRTDPGLILHYPIDNWRCLDYEIFEWDRYENILFFDIRDYDIQNRFFRRLAYFVEKDGYKGKILTNQELEGKHGFNAHDYKSSSLADFFNKARDANFELYEEEIILKEILILNGILIPDGEYVKANKGGIVSISRESLPGNRATFLAHEGYHTLFFDFEDFRNCVAAVYYTMDPISNAFLIDYFKSQPNLAYDTNDEYLMHNEFMAYILQNPLSYVGKYFTHHANRYSVRLFTPVLAEYVRDTNARGFEDAALILNDFVFDYFGTISGNISLVER